MCFIITASFVLWKTLLSFPMLGHLAYELLSVRRFFSANEFVTKIFYSQLFPTFGAIFFLVSRYRHSALEQPNESHSFVGFFKQLA